MIVPAEGLIRHLYGSGDPRCRHFLFFFPLEIEVVNPDSINGNKAIQSFELLSNASEAVTLSRFSSDVNNRGTHIADTLRNPK